VFSLASLEAKLVSYINDKEEQSQPFDASDIPKISKEQAAKESARASNLIKPVNDHER
jgi:coatomer subunit gamma